VLAESRFRIAVHYYQNESAAKETLAQVRQRGSNGFVVQGDVLRPQEISRGKFGISSAGWTSS
jgi:hypothetical protein